MLTVNLKHNKEIRYDEDGHMFPADYYIYVISVVVFGVLQAFLRKGLMEQEIKGTEE